MAPPNKILLHSEKDEIIRRLTSGDSVRSVAAWLNDKFPAKSQSHLRLAPSTLQQFRKEFLNLSGEVLADITEAGALTRETIKHEMEMEEVRGIGSYKEAIQSIVNEKIDVQRELIEIFHILKSRIEVFYDRLAVNDFNDKQERSFQGYITQLLAAMESYKKFVEGYTEKTESTININVMQGQVGIIREAVREVISDLDPELAVKFMGKLNEKMRALQYRDMHHAPIAVNSPKVYDMPKAPTFPSYPAQETPLNIPPEAVDG